MNPVGKALWFIESHYASDITLDDIATCGCVSRFHLSRAFEAATGRTVMRYVRSRRLSDAARALADGAPDILAVAVEAGYGSHEAFTRAFRDQFGVTPEAVRAHGTVCNIELVEPLKMDESFLEDLAPPRIETGKPLLVAGLSGRYHYERNDGIPAQWQRFGPSIGKIPGQVGQVAYGVCFNNDDAGNFDYLCGVEVADFSALPADLARVRIGEQRYAIFEHRDHISAIRRTWNTIWNKWLPESGHEIADAPVFERYSERFNPTTGMGGVELWIPLKS
ncbi:AraC family transcriptional regulator [Paraburkholderia gardini]|uniref:HTH-type transcriptional activator RhaS n=1 Tax=Paraburkholderia gardini TaxID=2823469 RepID=A0ABN7QU74_9BURK|nr:AraC family transcriptional regulator [Paraburkholderia gardini]CAG4920564.1 HTH-type transcriptional activator RhaS [Paraburkholderia gardini]CAG4923550.1 HTH-type transcriptional activator RhaS [Paraburkholderia gardini]